MTRLYALDVRQAPWRTLLPKLPAYRQEKVNTLRREEDQARSAGAGWLLQYALRQAGVQDPVFAETDLGKPYLENYPDIHFSLSHSGHWAVCAVGNAPLGVDVEQPRCTMEIGKRFFRPDELPETEDKDFLLRLWTAKEAFLKAIGTGLTVSPDSFRVILSQNEAVLDQNLSEFSFLLQEFSLGESRICLCTTEKAIQLEKIKAPLEGSCR